VAIFKTDGGRGRGDDVKRFLSCVLQHSVEESKAASEGSTWQASATAVLQPATTSADVTLCTNKLQAEY